MTGTCPCCGGVIGDGDRVTYGLCGSCRGRGIRLSGGVLDLAGAELRRGRARIRR